MCDGSTFNSAVSTCEVGDLSGKHGSLTLSGAITGGKAFYTDVNLPLSGANSVSARSIVVHAASSGGPRIGCGSLVELKYCALEEVACGDMFVPCCFSNNEVCRQDELSDIGVGLCEEVCTENYLDVQGVPLWRFGFGNFDLNGRYTKRGEVQLAGSTITNGYPIYDLTDQGVVFSILPYGEDENDNGVIHRGGWTIICEELGITLLYNVDTSTADIGSLGPWRFGIESGRPDFSGSSCDSYPTLPSKCWQNAEGGNNVDTSQIMISCTGNIAGDRCDSHNDCGHLLYCDNPRAQSPSGIRTCEPREGEGPCYSVDGGFGCVSELCEIDYNISPTSLDGFEGLCVDQCSDVTTREENLCQPPQEDRTKIPDGFFCSTNDECFPSSWCSSTCVNVLFNTECSSSCVKRIEAYQPCWENAGGGSSCSNGLCVIGWDLEGFDDPATDALLGRVGRCADEESVCPETSGQDGDLCIFVTEERMLCSACSSVFVGESCESLAEETSAPYHAYCYESGEVFLSGSQEPAAYCNSGFAINNDDCDTGDCRSSFTCVEAAIGSCPPSSFITSYPVQSFDDCQCSYDYEMQYSPEMANIVCVEKLVEPLYSCPDNAFARNWPVFSFEDCVCDLFYYEVYDSELKVSVCNPLPQSGSDDFQCPDNSYISATRWPIFNFEDDCTCEFHYVSKYELGIDQGPDCVDTRKHFSSEERLAAKYYAVGFASGISCDEVTRQLPDIVSSVQDTTGDIVAITGSSCVPGGVISAQGRRLQTQQDVTLAVFSNSDSADTPATSLDSVVSSLVGADVRVAGVAETENPGLPSDGGGDDSIAALVGGIVGALVLVGTFLLSAVFLLCFSGHASI
jgi:hypothetical protein